MNTKHKQCITETRKYRGAIQRTAVLCLMLAVLIACASTGKVMVVQAQRGPDWATAVVVEGVPNLHKINDNLYRSAQPSAEGMKNLEKLGIKTVINFREFHDDKDEVMGTNLKRIDIPMYAWDIKDKTINEALKQLGNKNDGPYLIHCMHGADRTGVVSAMYRILYEQWDKQKAIDEMRGGGFGFHEVWSNIIAYVENVDVQAMKLSLSK